MTSKKRFALRVVDHDALGNGILDSGTQGSGAQDNGISKLVTNGSGNGSPASVLVDTEASELNVNGRNRRTNPMATSAESKSTPQETEVKEAGRLDKLQNWAQDSVNSATRTTTLRTTDAATRINDFQKRSFERVMGTIGKLQDRTGETVHGFVKDSKLVPKEGVKVVEEWNGLVQRGREDFVNATVKSYDLVGEYIDRIRENATPTKA